jgi:hypothetical protein
MDRSKIVCGIGVPHVPVFPQLAAAGDRDLADRFGNLRGALNAADPSLLVVIANDHLNAFFLDRLPTFSIALGNMLRGPIDPVPGVAHTSLATDPAAAAHLAENLIDAGFDLMRSQDTDVDHAVIVPLHFLNTRDLPVVVLNVNAYVMPLPRARRCYDLGIALARAVESLPGGRPVGVIASGCFSQEVGGPRVDAGRAWSVPRPDWARRVTEAFMSGAMEQLLDEATPEMIREAGSVAGELLSWITMAGAAGDRGAGLKARIDYRTGEAFAFGIWLG